MAKRLPNKSNSKSFNQAAVAFVYAVIIATALIFLCNFTETNLLDSNPLSTFITSLHMQNPSNEANLQYGRYQQTEISTSDLTYTDTNLHLEDESALSDFVDTSHDRLLIRVDSSWYEEKYMRQAQKQQPNLLVVAGVRSSGTTELNAFLKIEYQHKTMCYNANCGEAHFWDEEFCFIAKTAYDTQNNLNVFEIDTNFLSTNDEFQCNVGEYMQRFYQTLAESEISIEQNALYYEKSPRYYVYPHLAHVFASHAMFGNSKFVILVRDPVKSSMSFVYDYNYRPKKVPYDTFYQHFFYDNFVIKYLKDDLLANSMPSIENILISRHTKETSNLTCLKNGREENGRHGIRTTSDAEWSKLIQIYEKIVTIYTKYVYFVDGGIRYTQMDIGRWKEGMGGFRNCHIIPLSAWLSQFNYFEQLQSNPRVKVDSRLKLIQSEYFFENVEDIVNRIICWTHGYDQDNSCAKTARTQNQDEFKWTQKRPARVVHSHNKKYVPESFMLEMAQWYAPCTGHFVNLINGLLVENTNIMWDSFFDPNLWTVAMTPWNQALNQCSA